MFPSLFWGNIQFILISNSKSSILCLGMLGLQHCAAVSGLMHWKWKRDHMCSSSLLLQSRREINTSPLIMDCLAISMPSFLKPRHKETKRRVWHCTWSAWHFSLSWCNKGTCSSQRTQSFVRTEAESRGLWISQ